MYLKHWLCAVFLVASILLVNCAPKPTFVTPLPSPLFVEALPTITQTPFAQVFNLTVTITPFPTNPVFETASTKATTSPSPTSPIKARCQSLQIENTIPQPNLEPKSYIGKIFDDLNLPDGLEFKMGSLIGDTYKGINYAFTEVVIVENNTHLLWLEELFCHQGLIHDVLVLPTKTDTEALVVNYCRINGQEDPEIFAIGEYTPGIIPLTTIEHVWRANRDTKKFEVMSPNGIECWRDVGVGSP